MGNGLLLLAQLHREATANGLLLAQLHRSPPGLGFVFDFCYLVDRVRHLRLAVWRLAWESLPPLSRFSPQAAAPALLWCSVF
jgi:hypothetical protein